MTRTDADEILWSITYKPGWQLEWSRVWGGDLGWLLRFEWKAVRPDRETGVEGEGQGGPTYVPYSDLKGGEHLMRLVFGAVLRYEEHEAREFFKVNGERPFDPHKRLLDV